MSFFHDIPFCEKINREALRWLKDWDPIVFKKKYEQRKRKPKVHLEAKKKLSNVPQFGDKPKREWKSRSAWEREMREKKRAERDLSEGPEKKVLLLSGAPGTGKVKIIRSYTPLDLLPFEVQKSK